MNLYSDQIVGQYMDDFVSEGPFGVPFTNAWDMTKDVIEYTRGVYGYVPIPSYWVKEVFELVSRVN